MIVTVWPATVIVPERGLVLRFRSVRYVMCVLPVRVGVSTRIQLALLRDDHLHAEWSAVTSTLYCPGSSATSREVYSGSKLHPACLTATLLPPIRTVPVRLVGSGFGATVTLTLPPAATLDEPTRSQLWSSLTDHEHSVRVLLTRTLKDSPSAGDRLDIGVAESGDDGQAASWVTVCLAFPKTTVPVRRAVVAFRATV